MKKAFLALVLMALPQSRLFADTNPPVDDPSQFSQRVREDYYAALNGLTKLNEGYASEMKLLDEKLKAQNDFVTAWQPKLMALMICWNQKSYEELQRAFNNVKGYGAMQSKRGQLAELYGDNLKWINDLRKDTPKNIFNRLPSLEDQIEAVHNYLTKFNVQDGEYETLIKTVDYVINGFLYLVNDTIFAKADKFLQSGNCSPMGPHP